MKPWAYMSDELEQSPSHAMSYIKKFVDAVAQRHPCFSRPEGSGVVQGVEIVRFP